MAAVGLPPAGRCVAAVSDASVSDGEMAMPFGGAGSFHRWLMDMLPQPIFVRTASGAILYANRAAAEAVGVAGSGRIERWQFTPRAVPRPANRAAAVNPTGASEPVEGELDLPRGAMSTNGPRMTLPAPSERHAVLLQDRAGAQRMVLSMNRMPFWLVDTAGSQQAVVMYVAS